MRQVSLNARTAHDAATTDEVEVVLMSFEHETLAAPLRLSTDPTERIPPSDLAAGPHAVWWEESSDLVYGTRSEWLGADPVTDPYLFVLASAITPGDIEDGPVPARLAIENVHDGIGEALRSIVTRATVHLAVVLASSPNVIEAEFRGLKLLSAESDGAQYLLEVSRLPIEEETVPQDRFTKERFPGLFR